MITRRRFLGTSSLFALTPTVPLFVARSARALPRGADARVLLVVELGGGNDALNTLVPHTDPAYERLRPTLKIARKGLVRVTDELGLHPALGGLDKLLQAGQLAVLPGVGYPNPNRSHFESMGVWHTGRPAGDRPDTYGWLGRALDPSAGASYVIDGVTPAALRGRRSSAVTLTRVEDLMWPDPAAAKRSIGTGGDDTGGDDITAFVRRQMADACTANEKLAKGGTAEDRGRYPETGLGGRLRLVARLLKTDLGVRVFYTALPGFDTHAYQAQIHARLLSEFAGAAAAFFADLAEAKLADRVVMLAFSEFGRTVKENGSKGTDHGTAGVVFLAGPGVKGGVVGTMPSLTDLEAGEPKMTTDFRRVYATVLQDWLGLPAGLTLGGAFETLPLVRPRG